MKKREKARLLLKVGLGFMTLYLGFMFIFTFIMREEYKKNYENDIMDMADDVRTHFYEIQSTLLEWLNLGANISSSKYMKDIKLWYSMSEPENEFHQISYYLYDEDKKLKDKTKIIYKYYDDIVQEDVFLDLEEYLTEQELKTLIHYISKNSEKDVYQTYRVLIGADNTKGESIPTKLYVERVEWFEADGTYHSQIDPLTGTMHADATNGRNLVQINSEVVWEWNNSESDLTYNKLFEISYKIPYLEKGYDFWEKWYEDDFLQESTFADTQEDGDDFKLISNGVWRVETSYVTLASYDNKYFQVQLYSVSYPYLAAMKHLKYVYLFTFIATMVCSIILYLSLMKMYEKRMVMEQNRKDFTNAMAHELKTPLSVIRSFSENISENIRTEKNSYYAKTIINQVDHMDYIVIQMLELSKMNAEDFKLILEPQDINRMVRDIITEFHPIIEEKQIQINLMEKEQLHLFADKKYIGLAIRNLISNAVSYTPISGLITIIILENKLQIENKGDRIPEDKLDKIWDMFYRVDEAATIKENHMGMGLYLVKRILELHHMNSFVDNTEIGVRVTIEL